MHTRSRWFALGASVLILVALSAISLFAVAAAAPPAQNLIPTPTLHPVEDLTAYTLDVVGGTSETLTFPGMTADGITVGETTAVSEYPRGMVFSVTAESEGGDIRRVTLLVELVSGSRSRVPAEWDADAEVWIAHPWVSGEGQPAWTPFTFAWAIADASDTVIETEPFDALYTDPTREWYRVETDHIAVYWFGAEDVDPDEIAQQVVEAMASTEPRRIDGFGRAISFKPVAVLYPTRDTLGEFSASGVTNATSGGWTSQALGMIIFQFALVEPEFYARQADCIYTTSTEDTRTDAQRIARAIYYGLPHEVTHFVPGRSECRRAGMVGRRTGAVFHLFDRHQPGV